jgi:serine/threonine protein kinase/Tol biopolymer transport system component
MALPSGTKLGPYEIVSPLGVGGMGEVYRARDSKLGREVALKVIAPEFAHDEQRMARFQREAQVLASLNHAHIASIYGFEDSAGVSALVMELVEGPTLAERIREGAIPVDEALPIARQIAEALECAHERGIIHRDLKPANIKLTRDGNVKVLDFGLAKALQDDVSGSDISNSPTLTMGSTKAGIILGTAAYMSPEQAKGKAADRRADIWSFGVVLYEMLSGEQAFGGETVSDSLAAVIKDTPDWTQLPAATPARIRELIQRCLQKDPKQRLQAIGDARIALDEAISGSSLSGSGISGISAIDNRAREIAAPLQPVTSPWLRLLPWLVAAALAIGLIATLITMRQPSQSSAQRAVALALPLPPDQILDLANGPAVVISPDASRIAFVTMEPGASEGRLFVRDMDKDAPVQLEGAGLAAAPFFSPDSQWIGYFGDGKLKKVSVHGGTPMVLAEVTGNRGGDWGDDGTIVFPEQFTSPLFRVPVVGGKVEPLTHLDTARGEITHRWPQILPGGQALIFTASTDNNFFAHASVEVAAFKDGAPKVLVENAYFGRYLPGGYLAYVAQGTVFVAPFDAKTLKLTGTAIPVLQRVASDLSNGGAQFSISRSGTVIFSAGKAGDQNLNISLIDRKGNATVLLKDQADASSPRFSPDGKRIVFQKGLGGLWIYDIARAMTSPVSLESSASYPVWTPDGQHLTYSRPHTSGQSRKGDGIYWRRADGSGKEEALTPDNVFNAYPSSWSPDGRTLAFERLSPDDGSCCEIWTLTVDENGKPAEPRALMDKRSNANGGFDVTVDYPTFSPDGHWLAYMAEQSGAPQVFVVPYPGPGGKWQVSSQMGWEPRWSKSGHEILYATSNQMISVPYTVENGAFQVGKPEVLFQDRFELRVPFPSFDVSADAQHFVMFQSSSGRSLGNTLPTVILNWMSQVRAQVAAAQVDSSK